MSNSPLAAVWLDQYRSLVRLAALLLDASADAEDVVQDAYVRVSLARGRPTNEAQLRAYLRQTVMNLARSRVRRIMTGRRHTIQGSNVASAEQDAYARLEQEAVVVALKKLPRRQREALVLRFYVGLSEAESATAMGIRVGTVKSTTSRALQSLGKNLEESHGSQ